MRRGNRLDIRRCNAGANEIEPHATRLIGPFTDSRHLLISLSSPTIWTHGEYLKGAVSRIGEHSVLVL